MNILKYSAAIILILSFSECLASDLQLSEHKESSRYSYLPRQMFKYSDSVELKRMTNLKRVISHRDEHYIHYPSNVVKLMPNSETQGNEIGSFSAYSFLNSKVVIFEEIFYIKKFHNTKSNYYLIISNSLFPNKKITNLKDRNFKDEPYVHLPTDLEKKYLHLLEPDFMFQFKKTNGSFQSNIEKEKNIFLFKKAYLLKSNKRLRSPDLSVQRKKDTHLTPINN